MRLWNISYYNLRRRKAKFSFLLAGLGVGVATVVALVSITTTLNRQMEEKLDRFGANIVISPRSEGLALEYGGISLGGVSYNVREISQNELDRIELIENRENIKVVAPKTLGVVETFSRPVLLAGVDFSRELSLKKWWRITGGVPASDNEVLAGHLAASGMGLSPGSPVTINKVDMKVSGVLAETGSRDDELLFADVRTAQRILGKEGLYSVVEVSALCRDCPVDKIVGQLSEQMPNARVTAVQQVVRSKMQALDHLVKFTVGITVVVLFIGVLIVTVTMMGSVKERTGEIGIFRAIGFRRGHVIRIILLEAVMVSGLAGILGWIFGTIVARLSLPLFTGGEGGELFGHPLIAAGAVAMAVVTGLLASIYPAVSAVRMAPCEALRRYY